MGNGSPRFSGKLYRRVYLGVVGMIVGLTLTALVDQLPGVNWGLSWSVFFIGFVVSAFGIAAYPLCSGCCDWERDRRQHRQRNHGLNDG